MLFLSVARLVKDGPKDDPKSRPLDTSPPPTMSSGYGGMSEDDVTKSPVKILSEHEARIRTWVKTLDGPSLVKHLKVAARHQLYEKFVSQSTNRNFGVHGGDDLVAFDLWLKKFEISEKRPMFPSPATPASPAPAAKKAPAPKAPKPREANDDDKGAGDDTGAKGDALPKLTPEQQQAYQNYWRKFSNTNLGSPPPPLPSTSPASPEGPAGTTSQPTPSTSPSPGTLVTPECKKRLDLDGSGQPMSVKQFAWDIYIYIYGVVLWVRIK